MRVPYLAQDLIDENSAAGLSQASAVLIAAACLARDDAAYNRKGEQNTDQTGDSTDKSYTDCRTLPIFVPGQNEDGDASAATNWDMRALATNPQWAKANDWMSGERYSRWYRAAKRVSLN